MKLKIVPLILISLLFISCTDKQTKKEIRNHQSNTAFNQYVKENHSIYEDKISKYAASLSLEQKIAQLFIENLEGCSHFRTYEVYGDMTGTEDKTPLVAGGYLFFGYNIADSIDQQQAFNKSILDYCVENSLIPPYLCVDQEGGWVSRLKKLNDRLPSNEDVAKNFTIAQSYSLYEQQAQQMKNLGFHMNLAPVIEICTPQNADFLDGRSFGTLEQVVNYGRACVNAYENNQIATVVKHFPGNTNTDPHTGLPVISLSKADLESSIQSFKEILQYEPAAILMSHAVTDAVDPGVPSCLSKVWVTEILRNSFNYKGLIFSDDIFMGALADNGYSPETAAVMAIEAGVDCIMISEKRFAKPAAVLYKKALKDSEFARKIDDASLKVIQYKVKAGIINIE